MAASGLAIALRVAPFLLLPLLFDDACAQALLRDINTFGADPGSTPGQGITVAGITYFPARTTAAGTELWRTDGTAAGTFLLRDINPGSVGAFPGDFLGIGTRLFFTASEPAGSSLWVTDGTVAGTMRLRDETGLSDSPLGQLGGRCFFGSSDGQNGAELFVSDGTVAGTFMLADLNPGPGNSFPRSFATAGGLLYFSADLGSGAEPWVTDGTLAGTRSLGDLNAAGGSGPLGHVELGGFVYFSADGTGIGRELWRTDGTATGTQLVIDLAPGSANGLIFVDLIVMGNALYFVGADASGFRDVYRSDGTAAGTVVMAPGSGGSGFGGPQGLITNGTVLFFHRLFAGQLWRSDGTAAGTFLLPTPPFNTWTPDMGVLGNDLYIEVGLSIFNTLVVTDGSIANTRTILPTGRPVAANGTVMLYAADSGSIGVELWSTDGTPAGAALVANIQGPDLLSSDPAQFAAIGDGVVFVATQLGTGREPWFSDGTTAGTVLLADVVPGPTGSSPGAPLRVGNGAFFVANDELWRTDGTPGGTARVIDIAPGSADAIRPLADFQGQLLFAAATSTAGSELWVSNGTTAGTFLLRDILPGAGGGLDEFTVSVSVFNGRAYFAATNGTNGRELWATNGTTAGTQLVVDLAPGTASSFPTDFRPFGGRLWFSAATAATGRELFATDGTAVGTTLALNLAPGSASSDPVAVGVVGGRLHFRASSPATGQELWSTNGTIAGTTVLDFTPGPTATTFVRIAPGRDRVFFATSELHATDGTAAGTATFDLNPAGSSFPFRITAIGSGDHVIFSADDGVHGRELWISNGQVNGTRMVADISPGPASSAPDSFSLWNRQVFFAAQAPSTLREPWEVDLGVLGVPLVEPFGVGCAGSIGVPQLTASGVPLLGTTTVLTVTQAFPNAPVWFAFAFAPGGGPGGCASPEIAPLASIVAIADAAGTASLPFAWPSSTSFLGVDLFAQGFGLDTAGFLGFLNLSQGLRLLLGS